MRPHQPKRGSYIAVFRPDYTDGSAIMRVPLPGNNAFPDEKVRSEVATLRYAEKKTSIPIGSLQQHGDAFAVGGRPLTQDMNDLVVQAGVLEFVLSPENTTYSTSGERSFLDEILADLE
ncbi:hypothetical protein VTG60DRAFT_5637 [Thermothelomyces hinnuleus]